ncbi:MucBP domain-containing protein [Listeria riparia]|uniref:Internalin J (LPXTG motif) n=1 Tax=Listeria riparia FSL S10-1204 TaxID=1265816 RepID=W7D6E8_9LIST|nr:MucBP domain-containing protein [Listeria riparia]EUJ43356.1 internalin J (LPXTG motif) [Listeria riparia FSL S10-1204]
MYKQMTKFSWIKLFLCIVLIGSTIWLPKTAQAEDAPVFPVGKTFEEVMPDIYTRSSFGPEMMQTTEAEYVKNERKYATRIVTQADFDRVTKSVALDLGKEVTFDMEGMQYLRNLEAFHYYYGADMDDLSYLAPLKKLKYLSMGDVSSVTDLSPLRGLTNLEYLFLWSNIGITDLSPLANLTKLEQLQLNKTSVTSIAPLRNLTHLKHITIHGYFDDAWTLKDLPLFQREDTSYSISTTVTLPPTIVNKPTAIDQLDGFGNPLSDVRLWMNFKTGDEIGTFRNGMVTWNKIGTGSITKEHPGKNKYQSFGIAFDQEVKPQVAGQPVKVQYETETGDVLAAPIVLQGMQEFPYEAVAKAVDGYTLVAEPSNATGVFSDQPQTVRFVYKKVETGSVHVHYVDAEGKTVHVSDVYTGNVGEAYKLVWPTINGYQEVKEAPTSTGQYTVEPQEITLVYVPEEATKGIVDVQYVDSKGKVLRAPDRYEGKIGDAYTLTFPTIPGYRLAKIPEAKGTYGEGVTTLRVVYSAQEQEVEPEKDGQEQSPPSPTPEKDSELEQATLEAVPLHEKPATPVVATILKQGTRLPVTSIQEAGSDAVQQVIGARLPVTGDTSGVPMAHLFLGVFCFVSGMLLWRRRS